MASLLLCLSASSGVAEKQSCKDTVRKTITDMIRSMTAFARSSYEGKEFTLDVFIRTYNHRFLDINLKQPIELINIEGELRSLISRYLTRGRVEITIKTTFLKEGIYQVFINKGMVGKL